MKTLRRDENGYTDKARTIFYICNTHAPSIHNEVFAEWWLRAFPDEPVSESNRYLIEWVKRFSRGMAWLHMDNNRRQHYKDIMEMW